MRLLVLILFFVIYTNRVLCQDACNDILRYGIHNISDYTTENEKFNYVWSNIERNESKGYSGSGSLWDILDVSSDYVRTVFESRENEQVEAFKNHIRQRIATIDANIVSAWGNCMNQDGAKAWLEISQDQRLITLIIQAKKPSWPGASDTLKINSVSWQGGDLNITNPSIAKSLQKNELYVLTGRRIEIPLVRNDSSSFRISVEVNAQLTWLSSVTVRSIAEPIIFPDVRYFEKWSDGTSQTPTLEYILDPGWKIIGGGAETRGTGGQILLTSSYPFISATGNHGWKAKGKDHTYPDYGGKVKIGILAIYDPDDEFDVRIFSSSSADANQRPIATARVDNGYVLTGGGGLLSHNGPGVLFVNNFPINEQEWRVSGKDHHVVSVATATAYAIGIKPNFLTNQRIENRIIRYTSNAGHWPNISKELGISGFIMTCAGIESDNLGAGQLITKSAPTSRWEWTASAKDHVYVDTGTFDLVMLGVSVNQ